MQPTRNVHSSLGCSQLKPAPEWLRKVCFGPRLTHWVPVPPMISPVVQKKVFWWKRCTAHQL